MKPGLHDVVVSLHLSAAVMRRIRINLLWAFGYNALGIPLAAGAAFPAFHMLIPPLYAGAAMALSSVSVVCSSLLLRLYTPPPPPLLPPPPRRLEASPVAITPQAPRPAPRGKGVGSIMV